MELDLRNIKTTMGMETFSCKSLDMVEKEMWVYFLAYNLIRLIMVQAASLGDILPRQISFKHSFQIWKAYRQQLTMSGINSLKILCVLIIENTVGHRPGRIEPKAIKRRSKSFSLLMETREKARVRVSRYGHPKKQR